VKKDKRSTTFWY